MQRTVPATNAQYSYSGGGCVCVVSSVNDSETMQRGNNVLGMSGEAFPSRLMPQNYGFTSVCFDADKPDADGNTYGPEVHVQYFGSNRSGGIGGNMDDRRHRLKGLAQGDSAMFRGKDDRQQFHMAADGNYMSSRSDRLNRIALVPPPQQEQQPPQQGQQGQQGGQQLQKPKGQTSALDDNKKASVSWQQDKDSITAKHGDGQHYVKNSDTVGYVGSIGQSSYRADSDHSHIMSSGANAWCKDAFYQSNPPIIVPDNCAGGSAAALAQPGAPAGPPAPL